MPLYDYKCTDCEHHYETREGFDAPSRQTCPQCGGVAKRVLYPPPIVFKGSGFYVTDSRKGSQATVGESSYTANSTPKSDSAPAASDSKPAAAAASSDD